MKNEFKVAITIFIAIVVAVLGYRFMAEMPLLGKTYEVYAVFDRVDGVGTGTAVLVQGVKVGSVSRVRFTDDDSLRVDISFNMDRKLPEGSIAYIRTSQIIDKALEIERGDSDRLIESGGRIQGIYDEGLFGTIRDVGERTGRNIEDSTNKLSSVLQEIDEMLKESGRQDIQESLGGLNRSVHTVEQLLEARQQELEESIYHLRNTLRSLDGITSGQEEQIETIIANLESTTGKLDTTAGEMDEFSRELNVLIKKINEGDGSLGKLVNDPSLYNNLDSLSYNLNRLIKNVNDNPRDFLKHMRLVDIF